MNIKITHADYYEILQTVDTNHGMGTFTIYGIPAYKIQDGFILYVACEYCGEKKCGCEAPLDYQGRWLSRKSGENVLDGILRELIFGP